MATMTLVLRQRKRKCLGMNLFAVVVDCCFVVMQRFCLFREKLNEKEFELKELQVNMNQWKDLTAQRLAEKFQEELQLQVER